MPFLVRPSNERCREVLSRPSTYTLKLPTGGEMYFSVPIEVDSLPILSDPDLFAFFSYLPETLEDVMKTMGQPGVDNVRCVMRMIEDRLISTRNLTSMECDAWDAGHGFPEFGGFNNLIGFFWQWDVIHFERGSEAVAEYAFKLWEYNNPQSPKRKHVIRSVHFVENDVRLICWGKNGQCAFEWTCNGYTVCFAIHGGFFRDFAEWMSYRDRIEAYQLDLLEEGVASITNLSSGGWELVGPADRLYPTVKPQPSSKHHGKHDASHPVNRDFEDRIKVSRYRGGRKPNTCKDCYCTSSFTLTQESNARQQNNNPYENLCKTKEKPGRPASRRSHSDQAGLVDVERGQVHQHARLAVPQSRSKPRYTAKQLDLIEALAKTIERFRLSASQLKPSLVNFDEVAREARMQRDAAQRIPTIKKFESQHPNANGRAHQWVPPPYKPLQRTEKTLIARESASPPRISHGHREQHAKLTRTTFNPFASTYHHAHSVDNTPVTSYHYPARTTRSSTGICGDSRGSTTPRYQAYAEDSQEDSPRPTPGSWRDV